MFNPPNGLDLQSLQCTLHGCHKVERLRTRHMQGGWRPCLWSRVVQFLASGKPVPKTSGTRSPSSDRHSVVVGVSHGEKATCTVNPP